jgi:type IV pilus assembly protein PilW
MNISVKIRAFTLVEVMVAMALGIILLGLIVSIFMAVRSGSLLQNGLASLQEQGRIAINLVSQEVRKTGFRKPVWVDPLNGYHPITSNSVNGASGANDTLQIMYLDAVSCLNVLNVNLDPDILEPKALYKRITFSVDATNPKLPLQWSCEYGDSPNALSYEITDQPIIDGVESFQILYGVDTDLPIDFSVNNWATADEFNPETSICLQSLSMCMSEGLSGSITSGVPVSLQIGLLLRSPDGVAGNIDSQTFNVLDVSVSAANDTLIRKLYTTTITLRNLTI